MIFPILAFLVGLAGCEIFLRLLLPLQFVSSNEAYRYDSELGVRAKPGHFLTLNDYQQEMVVNQWGTINFHEHFKGYDCLIFALGDSYTQGTGLYADASYPFQLDLLLNLDEQGIYRKKFGVVNLGLAAFGGEQSLIALKRYTHVLGKPSIILYLGCDNDYSDDRWFKSGNSHKSIVEGNPYWGWMYNPVKWIFVETEIGKRIKYLVSQKRLAGQSATIDISKRAKESTQSAKEIPVAELELDVLQRIIRTAEENRAQVILSWASDSPSYGYLRGWAEKNGYAFADWLPSIHSVISTIPALPAGNPHSGGHYRTWVNQVIARAYAKEIREISDKGF